MWGGASYGTRCGPTGRNIARPPTQWARLTARLPLRHPPVNGLAALTAPVNPCAEVDQAF